MRGATEQIALLTEEVTEAHREQELRQFRPAASTGDGERIRASLEAKYEAKLSELNSRLASIEAERMETEATLSRNLLQKTQEVETLRKSIDASAQSNGRAEDEVAGLRQQAEAAQQEVSWYRDQLIDLERCRDKVNELEVCCYDLSAIQDQIEVIFCRLLYRSSQVTSLCELRTTIEKLAS